MINLKKELLKYDELYCKYQSYLGRKTINNRTINDNLNPPAMLGRIE